MSRVNVDSTVAARRTKQRLSAPTGLSAPRARRESRSERAGRFRATRLLSGHRGRVPAPRFGVRRGIENSTATASRRLCSCLATYGIEEKVKALLSRKCGGEHAPEGLRERLMVEIRRTVVVNVRDNK